MRVSLGVSKKYENIRYVKMQNVHSFGVSRKYESMSYVMYAFWWRDLLFIGVK